MRRYHHYGVPTDEKRSDETLVQTHGLKFYSTPFDGNKWHIQWHRFPKDHGLPEILTKHPHIAFEVDSLEEEIKNAKVIFGPYSPLPGYAIAIIEEQGVFIELVETKLSDHQLSLLEKEEFKKSAKKI